MLKLRLLYPDKHIQRGDWVRTYEWHERLYLVDKKVFRCRRTDYVREVMVDIAPVKFGAKK